MCKLVQFLVLGVMGICFSAHALHSATLSVFPNPAYAGDLVSLVIKESIFQSGPRVKHIVKVGSIEAEIVNVSGTIITFRVPIETNAGEVLVSHEYESGDSDPLTTIMNIRNGGMSQYALPDGINPDPSSQYGKPIEAGKNPSGLPRGPIVYNPPGGYSNTPYENCTPMHIIDGVFSGRVSGSKNEWSDIIPIQGKFSNLYMDYCAETGMLYVLSDWSKTSKQPDASTCFSYFEILTGDGTEHWEIKINNNVGNGYTIKKNGIDISKNPDIVIGADYSFSSSPLASFSHTIYEFAIKVKPGNFIMPVYSNPVESSGPVVHCNSTHFGLVKDPSYFHGVLSSNGIELRRDERYVPLAGAAGLTTEPMVMAGTLGNSGSVIGRSGSVNPVLNCLSKHEIDGKFTRFPDSTQEWSNVRAATGRFSDLYADYCDGTLYILNDWVLGSEEPDKENCYNLFELTTGNGSEHWGIFVYHSLRKGIRVFLNGNDVSNDTSIVKGGKFGMDVSARDKSPHTVYEFGIKASEGAWKMFFCDPGPSSFCDNEDVNIPRGIQSNETGFTKEGELSICREMPYSYMGINPIINPLKIENNIDKPKENSSIIVLRTLDNTSEWGGSVYEVNVLFDEGYLIPVDVDINPAKSITKNINIRSKNIDGRSIRAIIDAPEGLEHSGELLRIICKSDNFMRDTTRFTGSLNIRNESRIMRTVPIQNGYAINERRFPGNSDQMNANILPITTKDGDILKVSFTLTEADHLSIKLYDETGRVLRSLYRKHYMNGDYVEQLPLNGLQKGMLYVMFTTSSGKSVTVPFVNKD